MELKKNKSLAVQYYKLAASQGNAMSCYNLGFIYQKGDGIQQDYYLAFRSFLQAGLLDHVNSKKHLYKIFYGEIGGYGHVPTQYLMEEWSGYHNLLHPNCRKTITEVFLCLKKLEFSDGFIPPELIMIVLQGLVEVWPKITGERHYQKFLGGKDR